MPVLKIEALSEILARSDFEPLKDPVVLVLAVDEGLPENVRAGDAVDVCVRLVSPVKEPRDVARVD